MRAGDEGVGGLVGRLRFDQLLEDRNCLPMAVRAQKGATQVAEGFCGVFAQGQTGPIVVDGVCELAQGFQSLCQQKIVVVEGFDLYGAPGLGRRLLPPLLCGRRSPVCFGQGAAGQGPVVEEVRVGSESERIGLRGIGGIEGGGGLAVVSRLGQRGAEELEIARGGLRIVCRAGGPAPGERRQRLGRNRLGGYSADNAPV